MARNKNRSNTQNAQYIERTQKKKKEEEWTFSGFVEISGFYTMYCSMPDNTECGSNPYSATCEPTTT
jgi:hypothetical protein